MPIYPFERSVFPKRYSSPFLAGEPIKAPGGIGDMLERAEGEKVEGGGIGRRRAKRTGPATGGRTDITDRIGQSKGLYVGPPMPGTAQPISQNVPPPAPQYERAASVQLQSDVDRSLIAAVGGAASIEGTVVVSKLPPETGKCSRTPVPVLQHPDAPGAPQHDTLTATRTRTKYSGSRPRLLTLRIRLVHSTA